MSLFSLTFLDLGVGLTGGVSVGAVILGFICFHVCLFVCLFDLIIIIVIIIIVSTKNKHPFPFTTVHNKHVSQGTKVRKPKQWQVYQPYYQKSKTKRKHQKRRLLPCFNKLFQQLDSPLYLRGNPKHWLIGVFFPEDLNVPLGFVDGLKRRL